MIKKKMMFSFCTCMTVLFSTGLHASSCSSCSSCSSARECSFSSLSAGEESFAAKLTDKNRMLFSSSFTAEQRREAMIASAEMGADQAVENIEKVVAISEKPECTAE